MTVRYPFGAAFTSQLSYSTHRICLVPAGTLAHYRAWAAQVQARYQMFNAEAARPARRIYVGGLPAGTQEVPQPKQHHAHGTALPLLTLLACAHAAALPSTSAAQYAREGVFCQHHRLCQNEVDDACGACCSWSCGNTSTTCLSRRAAQRLPGSPSTPASCTRCAAVLALVLHCAPHLKMPPASGYDGHVMFAIGLRYGQRQRRVEASCCGCIRAPC